MLIRRCLSSVDHVVLGVKMIGRGALYLLENGSLWKYLVVPICIHVILFAALFFGAFMSIRGFLVGHMPEVWWQIILAVLLIIALVGAVLFIGMMLAVTFGSVLSAPFYEVICERIVRDRGGVVPSHPWWRGIVRSMHHACRRLMWFVVVQAGLLLLYLVPFAFGPFAYVAFSFISTAAFLAYEYLEPTFLLFGWSFSEGRKWCMKRKGVVLGFGTALFILLWIPIVGAVIAPIALVSACLLILDAQEAEIK